MQELRPNALRPEHNDVKKVYSITLTIPPGLDRRRYLEQLAV